jgi:hypothetical protein
LLRFWRFINIDKSQFKKYKIEAIRFLGAPKNLSFLPMNDYLQQINPIKFGRVVQNIK